MTAGYEPLEELSLRADTIQAMTDLFNDYIRYMATEDNSPQEDQAEAQVQHAVAKLVDAPDGFVGHVLLALIAVIVDTAEPEAVQRWVSNQEDKIKEMLEKINGEQEG